MFTVAGEGANGIAGNGFGYDHGHGHHDNGWKMAVELGREENRHVLSALNGLAETMKANGQAAQTETIKNEINHIEDQITDLISSGQLTNAKNQSDILEKIAACCCSVKEAVGSVKENVNSVKESICDLKGDVGDKICDLGSSVKDNFYGLNTSVKDNFYGLNTSIKDNFYGLGSTIKDNFYGLNTTTKDGFCGLNTSLLQVAANLTEKLNIYNLQHTHQVDMGFCKTQSDISNSTTAIMNQAAANSSQILCAIKQEGNETRQEIIKVMCDDRTQGLRDQLAASNNDIQTAKLEAFILKSCGGHHHGCGCSGGHGGANHGGGNGNGH